MELEQKNKPYHTAWLHTCSSRVWVLAWAMNVISGAVLKGAGTCASASSSVAGLQGLGGLLSPWVVPGAGLQVIGHKVGWLSNSSDSYNGLRRLRVGCNMHCHTTCGQGWDCL